MQSATNPIRPYRVIVQDSQDCGYTNTLLVGTATTGLLRAEWVAARYGQLTPLNWSMASHMQVVADGVMDYMPLRYLVADAQNLIVAEAIRLDMEWVALVEHDIILPAQSFFVLNHYMKEEPTPIVSGLYFSRAYPSQPMVFRGMGEGVYEDWKLGDKVWCDGVPTGLLLIHSAVLRAIWEDSEPYTVSGIKTRRVFDTPRFTYYNPETGHTNMSVGTSDLEFCKRVIQGRYLHKSGWGAFADEHPQYPFLVDTNLFAYHCNQDGTMFPDKKSLAKFKRD